MALHVEEGTPGTPAFVASAALAQFAMVGGIGDSTMVDAMMLGLGSLATKDRTAVSVTTAALHKRLDEMIALIEADRRKREEG